MGRYADVTDQQVADTKKACEGRENTPGCELVSKGENLIKDSRAFCSAETRVLAVSVVSIIVALVLFFVAITNACKSCTCESCCGGKKKKNFINVIISGVGSLIALACWIIFLAHNGAWTRYKVNRKKIENYGGQKTKEPLKDIGWSGVLFEPYLIICLIWGFLLIVQRVVQAVFSFLASQEEWKEEKITEIEVA